MQTDAPEPHGRPTPLGRLEFGDALVLLYALVFARQYLWVVSNNALAWGLAVLPAAVAWYFYLRTKPSAPERTGREFWLLVALPLLFVYALRAPFPDMSFDVLNYRLLHAERSLRGTLFAPGDFFPTPAPYNPAPDTLTGLFRYALGYRLGTVVNLLSLVWAAQVVDRMLRPLVERPWARAACVLLVALAEHVLFEVNTYMIDVLAVPLLLEATRLSLAAGEGERRGSTYARVALLVGVAAGIKLTNLLAALPLVVLCAWRALKGPGRLTAQELPRSVLVCFALFAAPLVPFAVYMYAETGNPVLPLLNGFFKSPYWPTGGGWDARWGPLNFWQTLVWPVLVLFDPARHSELAVYSGRLSLGFVVALVGLLLKRARTLSLVFLGGALLWSAGGMGYSRYGLYLEVLAGLVVVAVAAALWKERASASWKPAVASVLFVALAAQAAVACYYLKGHEWSMRPTALSDWASYRHEARFILRDRRLAPFLGAAEREALGRARLWAEACPKSAGFEAMLDPRAPMLGVRHHEYFSTRESVRRFAREAVRAPEAFSLCLPEDVPAARELAKARGLEFVGAEALQLPFFSSRGRIGMMLVEISRPADPAALAQFEQSWMKFPFPDYDYRAEITTDSEPAPMRAGERREMAFEVRNLGGAAWPARGDEQGRYQVNIGDRWLEAGTERVVNDLDARTALAADLPPAASVTLTLAVTAPPAPGDYVLEIDMVHEGLTFFREKGSTPLRLPVRVE
jgi:hypothetical protein